MIGGHPIKLGLSRFLIDLIERGCISLLATNGSGLIHDFELAAYGGTSEDVAKWIKVGQFGLWRETGRLNDVVGEAASRNEGFGEGVGMYIEERELPHRDISIAAAGWRCGVPVTCHVSIGSDIFHGYPNCDGAALGKVSYTDFLIFARQIQDLECGVFLNIGSAVTGPEVYLKALSMARNVARQKGETISAHHGGLRRRRSARELAGRSWSTTTRRRSRRRANTSAVLLPSLENDPLPHGRRRRQKMDSDIVGHSGFWNDRRLVAEFIERPGLSFGSRVFAMHDKCLTDVRCRVHRLEPPAEIECVGVCRQAVQNFDVRT